jgi:hypothetical protein
MPVELKSWVTMVAAMDGAAMERKAPRKRVDFFISFRKLYNTKP